MSDDHREPVRARRKPSRRGRTRTRLLDAAVDVFAERGIEGATVELICERAGFTRGAFYSNFSTKEELLLAAAEHALRGNGAHRGGRRPAGARPRSGHAAQVHALVAHFLGPEDPRGERVEVELRRLARDDPDARALLLRMNAHIGSRVFGVVALVGALAGCDSARPLVVVRTLVALHQQAAELAWLTGAADAICPC